MAQNRTWNDEDNWWRNNFTSRPYATGRNYEDFRPAYQYGFESGQHHLGRKWNDVETDLRSGWEKFEGKKGAGGTWESVKDAVKDAWTESPASTTLTPTRWPSLKKIGSVAAAERFRSLAVVLIVSSAGRRGPRRVRTGSAPDLALFGLRIVICDTAA